MTIRSHVVSFATGVLLLAIGPAYAQQEIWQWDGENSFDFFGCSVALSTDVDGDGICDVIVDANEYPHPTGDGRIYVYSGKTGAIAYTITGDQPEGLGFPLSPIGDINHDGVSDFIAGAPTYSGGSQGYDAGRALTYSGADGGVIFDLQGTWQSLFGVSVAGVGDLDGDGVSDFLIADQYSIYSPDAGKGRVFVYSGNSATVMYSLVGEQESDGFGQALARIDDVDGDGFGDFVVGAQLYNTSDRGSGAAYLYSGHSGSLLFKLKGDTNGELLGYAVSGAGDQDGDGVSDFLVGTYATDRAFVYSSRTGALLYELDGLVSKEFFGQAVADVGDVNGDGVHDLVVSAPNDSTLWHHGGRVDLFSGRSHRRMYQFPGDGFGSYFGTTLAGVGSSAGDVNGDGIPDFVVGAPSAYAVHPAGRAYVYAGNDLYLQATPPDPLSGQTLTLDTRGGAAQVLTMLVLTEINGTPTFTPLLLSTLDANGEWSVQGTVPPGFSGLDFKLRSYAQKSLTSHGIIDSSDAEIVIQ